MLCVMTEGGVPRSGSSGGLRERIPARVAAQRRELHARTRRVLTEARSHLSKRALKLIAFVAGALIVFQLIPGLQKAFDSLTAVSWQWILVAAIVEALSESGFVVAWRGIVDADKL